MKLSLLAAAFLALSITGCNAYNDAVTATNTIGTIVTVAEAAVPNFQATGVFSASEAAAITGYLGAVGTLNAQTQTCVGQAQTAGGKKAAFLGCFNTFASALASPAELAQLRILNPNAQKQVQIWVTAISLTVNVILKEVGGTQMTAPTVSAYQPTDQDIQNLRARVWDYQQDGRLAPYVGPTSSVGNLLSTPQWPQVTY